MNEDDLKNGEFISKNGRIVKPDRTEDRLKLVRRKVIKDEDIKFFKEREMMKEKFKNSNVIRDVLKK